MINIDWLNSLLEHNSIRDITKQIWRYTDKIIATNGFALIAISADKIDHDGALPDFHENNSLQFLNHEYRSITSYNIKVDLQDFKQFLGEPENIKECDCKNVFRKCTECNGKGIIECNLGEEHDCMECGGDGGKECIKCVDGWIIPKPRYIGIFDVVVNGNVLVQYLQELHDVSVTISCNGENPVKFSGNGWDVYIMPVRDVRQKVRRYEKPRT